MKFIIKDSTRNFYVKRAKGKYLNWTNKIDESRTWSKRVNAETIITKYKIENAIIVPAFSTISLMYVNGVEHG